MSDALVFAKVQDYPLLNLFWTMLWLFLWILWIFLLFRIITDIFRSRDLNGWGKAAWLIFVIILPFLGVFVYLVARGNSMHTRDVTAAKQNEEAFRSYVQEAASGSTTSDELTKLAGLHDKGVLTDEEFNAQKAKLLSTGS
jgi:Short C-terminal domain/Phospholipase_D-nuclease N-terminal